jgi:hypothetical protein
MNPTTPQAKAACSGGRRQLETFASRRLPKCEIVETINFLLET